MQLLVSWNFDLSPPGDIAVDCRLLLQWWPWSRTWQPVWFGIVTVLQRLFLRLFPKNPLKGIPVLFRGDTERSTFAENGDSVEINEDDVGAIETGIGEFLGGDGERDD